MASAWGTAWWSAWGDSWGVISTVPEGPDVIRGYPKGIIIAANRRAGILGARYKRGRITYKKNES